MRRFGELRTYKHGERLFETGKPGPGMFVVLSGHVAITQRDGLGHVTPVIDQGPGQFLAEIGQLSGRVALVDGHAEGDVETLLIPPEQIARAAGRRSRSRRAHHARADPAPGQPDPGRRRRPGADRPVEFGRRRPPAGISHPQRLSASSARSRQRDHDAAELIARYSPSPTDWPLVVTVDGTVLRNPGEIRARARAGHDRRPAERQGLRRRRSSAAVRPGLSTAVYAASEGLVGGGAGCARLRRPGRRQRAHRELSRLSDRHFRARRWPAAPSTRRRSSAPTS